MDGQLPPKMEWQKIVTLLEEIVKSHAWQPIATAPKDRVVTVYIPEGPIRGVMSAVKISGLDRWFACPTWDLDDDPTHWMPLPPPPQKEGT